MARPYIGRGETPSGIEYTWDVIGRLHGIEEETDCERCGAPLEVGDRAYLLENGTAFCGDTCLNAAHPETRPREEWRGYAQG